MNATRISWLRKEAGRLRNAAEDARIAGDAAQATTLEAQAEQSVRSAEALEAAIRDSRPGVSA